MCTIDGAGLRAAIREHPVGDAVGFERRSETVSISGGVDYRAARASRKIQQSSKSELASALMPVAVEQGDVDPPAQILIFELHVVGFVEQVGVEDEGPVRAVGNADRLGA